MNDLPRGLNLLAKCITSGAYQLHTGAGTPPPIVLSVCIHSIQLLKKEPLQLNGTFCQFQLEPRTHELPRASV